MSMTFAESYVLASKVRSKLTKEAANPKSSLRSLVLQANMLDNLMDHISAQAEKKRSSKVSFSLPEKKAASPIPVTRGAGPMVTEYELESDSESDLDSDFDDSDSESDSESDLEFTQFSQSTLTSFVESDEEDFYYSSDEEDELSEIVQSSTALASVKSYKLLPVMNLSADHDLLVIYEEQEDELPELSRSTSDSESEDEVDIPSYTLAAGNGYKISSEDLLRRHGHQESPVDESHRHQRHNAIYLMEHVF